MSLRVDSKTLVGTVGEVFLVHSRVLLDPLNREQERVVHEVVLAEDFNIGCNLGLDVFDVLPWEAHEVEALSLSLLLDAL